MVELLLRLVVAPTLIIVLVCGTVALRNHRRTRTTPGPFEPSQVTGPVPGGDPIPRQAWLAAYQAHARLARLEDRVRELEANALPDPRR
jgi:hypothetical protein